MLTSRDPERFGGRERERKDVMTEERIERQRSRMTRADEGERKARWSEGAMIIVIRRRKEAAR